MNETPGNQAPIQRTRDLVREMIILADEGEAQATDDGCVVLFGVVRDCAYRIRAEIDREKARRRLTPEGPQA